MKKFNHLTLAIISILYACSEVELPKNPEIYDVYVSTSVENQKVKDGEILIGEKADLSATVDDDQGVKSIKLEIYPAYGQGRNAIGWKYSYIYNDYNYPVLVGFPADINFSTQVEVPDYIYTLNVSVEADGVYVDKKMGDAWIPGEVIIDERDTVATPEGEYHFVMTAIDVNNNESAEAVTEVKVLQKTE